MKKKPETVTDRARRFLEKSGLTYQEVGVRMGFPKESARQNVFNFLNGVNPTVATTKRFAEAIGVKVEELL